MGALYVVGVLASVAALVWPLAAFVLHFGLDKRLISTIVVPVALVGSLSFFWFSFGIDEQGAGTHFLAVIAGLVSAGFAAIVTSLTVVALERVVGWRMR